MDGEPPPAAPPSLPDQAGSMAATSRGALAAALPGALAAAPAGLPDGAGSMAAASRGALAAGQRHVSDGQAAQAGAADGLQPAVEASIEALALARSFLPTAPHPTRECNIPVVQVQRYILHPLDLLFFSIKVLYRNKTRFGLFIGPK
jgi:hypothetical protein